MTLRRLTVWTLFATAGFAILSARSAAAQDTPLPQPDRTANSELNRYKEKETRGISKDELPTAKKHFEAFAKYYAAIIAHPLIYKAAQDPSIKLDSTGRPIPPLDGSRDGTTGILTDLQRFIPEPLPSAFANVTVDRADYIREMGIALDAALKPVIETHADRIVRVNAARLLAAACKSGATAHYPTVTELLTNANTPPDVKQYVLQAAANLLAAYDVFDYKSRRHSNGWKQPRIEGDKELGALVAAIEKCILDPGTLLGAGPKWDVKQATPDQEDVIRFVRRQAIRALGQVRFVTIPGPDGTTPLYPAYTLARVCVSDPAVSPAPTPAECAEAAIGLCNMSPVVNNDRLKGYNDAAAVEAITAALVTFSAKRAEDPVDRSLPWRGYGLRLADAMKNWRPLFDVYFDPTKPNNFAASEVPATVNDLIQRAQTAVFTPLEKVGLDGKPDLVGGRVEIEKLREFLNQQRESKTRNPLLFTTNKETVLYAPDKK